MGEEKSKRFFPRIEIESIVAYVLMDRAKNLLAQGVGKVLNLSQGGLLIQTHEALEAPYILISLIGSGNSELTILGQVVHCRQAGELKFNVGIKFLESEEKKRQVVTSLVKAYSQRKHSG